MITAVCERMGVPCRLRFVGISRGVCLGLIKMSERFLFEKYLLINMPRMINFHKTTKAIPEKSLVFVYGEKDISYTYLPFLEKRCANIVVIEGANHQFYEMAEVFVNLVSLL